MRLDSVKQDDYDTVFYPGGHGPMWDVAEDKNSIKLLESFVGAGKTFAVVCHSTGALHRVKTPDGKFLVEGKTVTGFTNGEEDAVQLTKVVPFLVEDEMMKLGYHVFQSQGLGRSHSRRWPADHRPEPGLVWTCRETSHRHAEQEGEIVRPAGSVARTRRAPARPDRPQSRAPSWPKSRARELRYPLSPSGNRK